MRRFILLKHTYAPEMNRIMFDNGVQMPTPGLTTLQQVKKQYFAPVRHGKFVEAVYDNADHPTLSRFYSGYVKSYHEIVEFLKERNVYHNMPNGEWSISIRTI